MLKALWIKFIDEEHVSEAKICAHGGLLCDISGDYDVQIHSLRSFVEHIDVCSCWRVSCFSAAFKYKFSFQEMII